MSICSSYSARGAAVSWGRSAGQGGGAPVADGSRPPSNSTTTDWTAYDQSVSRKYTPWLTHRPRLTRTLTHTLANHPHTSIYIYLDLCVEEFPAAVISSAVSSWIKHLKGFCLACDSVDASGLSSPGLVSSNSCLIMLCTGPAHNVALLVCV